MDVEIKRLHADALIPEYKTEYAAGMDLSACIEHTILLAPGERTLVNTGISIALPFGFEAQVRPRSGLALKYGIGLVNSPGTIDADYRGEIKVLMINLGDAEFEINSGDRIAQLVVAPVTRVEWQQVSLLNNTARNAGGFGHTGVKD